MKHKKLVPYTLKLEEDMWTIVDRNRMSMVGVLSPQGVTKVDYIRNALDAYNVYWEKKVTPRMQRVKDIEDPLPVYLDNGIDVVW
jgi:hypothetical protein|tara:strand:+ start:192 stop:446 length:255 start_codon:yes stop_codon:yes gene_type:complete